MLCLNFEEAASYIEFNFSGKVLFENPFNTSKLLLYLSSTYNFLKMSYFDHDFLLMDCSKTVELSIPSLEKHIRKVEEVCGYEIEVILVFDVITKYLRNKLIENRVSFVVPGKQIFLPTVGSIFTEKRMNRYSKQKDSIHKISPTTEALILEIICSNEFPKHRSELARKLDVSEMSISRAIKELNSNEITSYNNVEDIGDFTNKIIRNARQIFAGPIMKKIYVKRDSIQKDLWRELSVSGESALSEETMLIKPRAEVYGIMNRKWKVLSTDVEEVPHEDFGVCQVELWRHQLPKIRNRVHPIALYIMFMKEDDERIKKEMEILLERFLKDYKK